MTQQVQSLEHLQSSLITDNYGTVYGENPPSNNEISRTVNDLIDEIESLKTQIEQLKKPKYESGYLRSIFG